MMSDDLIDLPATWSGPHVALRLVEAMRTLRAIPMRNPNGYGTSWPGTALMGEDLLAQLEGDGLGQESQNSTRPLPTAREVQRMEAALYWPTQFLAQRAPLMNAVNAVAWAHAIDRDCGWIARRRGSYADKWRERHAHGCNIIARGLRADRVPVF